MSVKVRKYKRVGYEVDIRIGGEKRERRKSPVSSKSGSKRWGEARERELLAKQDVEPPKERKEVPTLEQFAPRFLDNYARANRQKPSGVAAKDTILLVHLVPLLGQKRLDERKQLLRVAIREVVVQRDGTQLVFTVHWAGDTCTRLSLNKRATPVGSRTDPSLTALIQKLAETLDDGEIARILNMKKLNTPRGVRWTKDRVQSFRSRNHIKQSDKTENPDVMTGQQARDYLGIGYNGLMALVHRDVIHTNQVTDFAPWRIARAAAGT